ncbi:MAG: hypothetical protein JSV27_02095 [Candidatus Bathyarchaeota archaeon]|nr:MAG: hypothetical protein JSV27_02095 [Candidatus Bathyarchaeota archaeon]
MNEGGERSGRRLLLMGSSAFKTDELPAVVRERLDEAMALSMTIIVGEARGACRRFQDYLESRGYSDVIVGHAKSIRYNAGGWRTVCYGDDLKERERGMIEDCDSAIIVWVNNSGQIAKNLELLKRLNKPTFVYELSTKDDHESFGMIDPGRVYSHPYRPVWARARGDSDRLGEVLDAFLASGDTEQLVEGENPGLTGYYLNKLIMERDLRERLEVAVESGSCYLRRVA